MVLKFRGGNSGSSGGGISNDPSKPNASERVVQGEKPRSRHDCGTFNRGECVRGRPYSEGCAVVGEESENWLGVAGPGFADSNFVQSEHVGELTRTKNEGLGSEVCFTHGEQAYAQLARVVNGNGSGCDSTQFDSVSRRGADERDVEADHMEFEGGSGSAANLC
nr:hypothetical protein CFP56_39929 [Quercus suber]